MPVISRRALLRCAVTATAMHVANPIRDAAAGTTAIDPQLKARIKAISNIFETGRPAPDYAYVEDLRDGRGYTVSHYGFCTYADEVSAVIREMLRDDPQTPLRAFLAKLPPVEDGLDTAALRTLPAAWRKEAHASPSLPAACDIVGDRLFFDPSQHAVAMAGIRLPIGRAIFYDTWLQHGDGSDADSFAAINRRAIAETGGIGKAGEAAFLADFLGIRRAVLQSPANDDTAKAWKASSSRVDALAGLLAHNPRLAPPFHVASADHDELVF